MSLNTIIVRAIRGEVTIAQDGTDALKAQKASLTTRRDLLQTELDAVKADISRLTTEIADAQNLITDLQSEIDAVQLRGV